MEPADGVGEIAVAFPTRDRVRQQDTHDLNLLCGGLFGVGSSWRRQTAHCQSEGQHKLNIGRWRPTKATLSSRYHNALHESEWVRPAASFAFALAPHALLRLHFPALLCVLSSLWNPERLLLSISPRGSRRRTPELLRQLSC